MCIIVHKVCNRQHLKCGSEASSNPSFFEKMMDWAKGQLREKEEEAGNKDPLLI
jgi:uncharacterized Fe-S center protein